MWAKVGENVVFRGLNALMIDDKGRMAIPARYRDVIKKESKEILIITIDTEERCLLVYTTPSWNKIEQKLEGLPSFHPTTRRIQRLLIGHATEVEMDRSGRVLIPPLLRDYAGLDKNVMLVGQGNKFELWGEKEWQAAREVWLAQGLFEVDENGSGIPHELKTFSL